MDGGFKDFYDTLLDNLDIMFFNKFMWIFSLNPWGKIW